jgi:hypothetical protein
MPVLFRMWLKVCPISSILLYILFVMAALSAVNRLTELLLSWRVESSVFLMSSVLIVESQWPGGRFSES